MRFDQTKNAISSHLTPVPKYTPPNTGLFALWYPTYPGQINDLIVISLLD
jgi:hypothetical protein